MLLLLKSLTVFQHDINLFNGFSSSEKVFVFLGWFCIYYANNNLSKGGQNEL